MGNNRLCNHARSRSGKAARSFGMFVQCTQVEWLSGCDDHKERCVYVLYVFLCVYVFTYVCMHVCVCVVCVCMFVYFVGSQFGG